MAKTGQYLNGKELLECELEKLDRVDKVQSMVETNQYNLKEATRLVFEKCGKDKKNVI